MKKKHILFLLFIFLNISILAFSQDYRRNNPVSIYCDPQLQPYLKKIQQVPEAQTLLTNIQKTGRIAIIKSDHPLARQFGAFWDPDRRMIHVNLSHHSTPGELVGSLLFEMHNALVNSKIEQLDELAAKGEISKDRYVEGIEFLEYKNSIDTAKITDSGIRMGIFPHDARMQTYGSFEEHYRIQKMGGHSAWIAKTYDQLAPQKS